MPETVNIRLDKETAEALLKLQQRLNTDRSKAVKAAIKIVAADAGASTADLNTKLNALIATVADLVNVTVQHSATSQLSAADTKKWVVRSTAFCKAIAEKTQARELATQFYAEWQKEGK